MNNKVVVDTFNTFVENDFSVCRVNFRGVGKSDGEFDNGQGELADAAAALDWIERENFDNSHCRSTVCSAIFPGNRQVRKPSIQ